MIRILLARLRQGHQTSGYPHEMPNLPDRYRGQLLLDPERCPVDCRACIEACPTDAIAVGDQGTRLDLGRCLFCQECTEACPEGAIRYTSEFRMAARQRAELVVQDSLLPRVRALDRRMLDLFGRSLKLRQVSAGGCNGCEADVNVLGTIVFDLGRFGIQFVASPRHADGLLITGPVTRNMELALLKTYEAVPAPKIVIAVGACAISGGPYLGHDEALGGAASVLPVDLFIPGCPPHPYTILDGLLSLLDKIGTKRVLGEKPPATPDPEANEPPGNPAQEALRRYRNEIRAQQLLWGTKRANEAADLFGIPVRRAKPKAGPASPEPPDRVS